MTNDRLRTYTLAAGATTLLATAGSVSGDIISSDGAMTITQSNQGGGGDIELFTFAGVRVQAANNFQNIAGNWKIREARIGFSYTQTPGFADRFFAFTGLSVGQTIDENLVNSSTSTGWATRRTSAKITGGAAANEPYLDTEGPLVIHENNEGENSLLAFRIESPIDGSIYFGWIDYTLQVGSPAADEGQTLLDPFVFTVNAWAYNDVAGEGILAGQNVAAGSSAVPGLSGLAALAIGAAGVRSRRQRVA